MTLTDRIPFRLASGLVLGIALASCSSTRRPEPTAGLAVYQLNSLDAYDAVSMDDAWSATEAAIERLGFLVTRRNRGPNKSELFARTQGNRTVEIRMTTETAPLLHTRIRVETLGDESLSRLVLEQIRKRYADIVTGQ